MKAVLKAGAEVIVARGDEDLGLVAQTPERSGVEYPCAIPLEGGSEVVRTGLVDTCAETTVAGKGRALAKGLFLSFL